MTTTFYNPTKVKNIGIFAHVDAGKTTLTEQLLYFSGAIKAAGRVDRGNTHTDTLQLERERGISIMSQPISYTYNDTKVNIIDTPGHVDFVAEVERVMGVLEGAVLVISAVEGVQSHSRLLFKTLQRLKIPTIIFINKIDRMGADVPRVIHEIGRQLTEHAIPIQGYTGEGSRGSKVHALYESADVLEGILNGLSKLNLKEADDLVMAYLERGTLSKNEVAQGLGFMSHRSIVYPLLFGSALAGVGVETCLEALDSLLPCFDARAVNESLAGVAFKVTRSHVKTREVYIKLTSGHVGLREMLGECKVTGLVGIQNGQRVECARLFAGDIGIFTGLHSLKVNDTFGNSNDEFGPTTIHLSKPMLVVQVKPIHEFERPQLLEALNLISDADPYLQYQLSEVDNTISLHLFGAVQMEILSETLQRQYGIGAVFSEPNALYMETPIIGGQANVPIYAKYSFAAGLGFRIEPLPLGSGIVYDSEVTEGYLTKTFQRGAMEGALEYLDQGLMGWGVTDLRIVLCDYGFDSVISVPSAYRDLAPLVVYEALQACGTRLLWPMMKFELKAPLCFLGEIFRDLSKMRASLETPLITGDYFTLNGRVPVETSMRYAINLAHMTDDKGLIEMIADGYEPVPDSICPQDRPYYRAHPAYKHQYLQVKGAISR